MNVREDAENVIAEIFEKAKIEKGDIVVIGCSSSEIL